MPRVTHVDKDTAEAVGLELSDQHFLHDSTTTPHLPIKAHQGERSKMAAWIPSSDFCFSFILQS